MNAKVSTKTLYLNADKTKVVEEGSPDAAFLLVREGAALPAAEAERYGVQLQEVPAYDAVADHAAKHGAETDAQAALKRTASIAGIPDAGGTPQEGERGTGVKNGNVVRANKSLSSTDGPAETKAS